MPLLFCRILVLKSPLRNLIDLLLSCCVVLVASLLFLNHALQVLQMLLPLFALPVQLLDEFFVNSLYSTTLLASKHPIFFEEAFLFVLKRELLLQIIFSLIVHNFVEF